MTARRAFAAQLRQRLVALGLFTSLTPGVLLAQDAGSQPSLPPGHPTTSAPTLPPGHPPTAAAPQALPPGHPATEAPAAAASTTGAPATGQATTDQPTSQPTTSAPVNPAAATSTNPNSRTPAAPVRPPGHPTGNNALAMRGPLPDRSSPDGTLEAGSIVVEVRDKDDRPVSGVEVELQVTRASIAEGDSDEVLKAKSDANGVVKFSDLERTLRHNYAVSVDRDGATYVVDAFRLTGVGHRVILHTYEVTSDVDAAFVGIQALLSIALRSDHFQVEVMYRVMPMGNMTWRPNNVVIRLPKDAFALDVSQKSGDSFLIDDEGKVKLSGTYPPGQNQLGYTFQIKKNNEESQLLEFNMPPQLTNYVVLVEKAPGLSASISGLASMEETSDRQGHSFFLGRRTMAPGDSPVSTVSVELRGLPVIGPGRYYAVSLAIALALGALFLSRRRQDSQQGPSADRARARKVLLDEMVLLERARKAEEIGPRTYDETKRRILLALSRLEDAAA